MNKRVKAYIQQAFLKIVEEWGLMLIDNALEITDIGQCFDSKYPIYLATLHFDGPFVGSYSVACQEGFARSLVLNLLGIEDDVDEDQVKDAVKELVNVLAGNLIVTMYGQDNVFALEAPEVKIMSVEEGAPYFVGPGFGCYADGQPVAITFSAHEKHEVQA